jgi:hypothetical protein
MIAESASRSSDPSWGSGVQLAARAVNGADSDANANKTIDTFDRKRIATFILFARSMFHEWRGRQARIPQGLKPLSFLALFGTTEVVPFHETIDEASSGKALFSTAP